MKLIAHRGNLNGPNAERENSPAYVLNAIDKGYDAEADLWSLPSGTFLGHDEPQYRVDESFLRLHEKSLWIHAKNTEAAVFLHRGDFKQYFWHQKDDRVLTSNNYLWTYIGKELTEFSIAVLPKQASYSVKSLKACYGICSDYVEEYRNMEKIQSLILSYVIDQFGEEKPTNHHHPYCKFPEEDCSCKFLSEIFHYTSLITGGYVDSFSMVVVLLFLEETFNIKISDLDASQPAKFDSVDTMTELVQKYKRV